MNRPSAPRSRGGRATALLQAAGWLLAAVAAAAPCVSVRGQTSAGPMLLGPPPTDSAASPGRIVLDAAVDRAVLFLARRQVPPPTALAPDAAAGGESGSFVAERHALALTALSVLAMLSAGHTEDDGRYGLVLLRAADHLLSREPPDGFYGRLDGSRMYGHALVTLALAELTAQTFSPDRRTRFLDATRRATHVLLAAQNVEKQANHAGGWRYEPTSGDSDLSVTAWCVVALSVSRRVGSEVPADAFARAAEYALRCVVRAGDRVEGFSYQPGGAVQTGATAAGLLILGIAEGQGVAVDGDRQVRRAAAESLVRRPVRFEDRFAYYTAHASVAAAVQMGPDLRRPIVGWATPLMLSLQQDDGGWPTSRTGEEPGRIYATAMAILTLTAPSGVLISHQTMGHRQTASATPSVRTPPRESPPPDAAPQPPAPPP